MFNFFSDVKARLTALETKIEQIWDHLFGNKNNVPPTPTTESTPATEAETNAEQK